MSEIVRNAVVLVTSRTSPRFGTGFIVHHDSQGTFVLTCAHVIEDVGGEAGAVVNHRPDLPVSLIASGLGSGIDLAVILARGLADRPVLQLSPDGVPDLSVIISGYRSHTQQGHILRSIRGTLGGQVFIQAKDVPNRAPAWDLRIEGDDQLADGYSGSPVVDEESRLVVAIASHLEREGRRGQAISAAAVAAIWPTLPPQAVARRLVKPPPAPTKMPPATNQQATGQTGGVHGAVNVFGQGKIVGPAIGTNTGTVISDSTISGDVVVGRQYNYYGSRDRQGRTPEAELQPDELTRAMTLRQLVTTHFNLGELNTLCFDLGIDYESLPGQGKIDRVRELVAHVKRHGQMSNLLTECRRLRPHVDWPS
ncbi:MAG: trypsin-like peptidase domain-containing protein [Chloroflexales bacterium]